MKREIGWEAQVPEVATTWEMHLLVELVCRNHQKPSDGVEMVTFSAKGQPGPNPHVGSSQMSSSKKNVPREASHIAGLSIHLYAQAVP